MHSDPSLPQTPPGFCKDRGPSRPRPWQTAANSASPWKGPSTQSFSTDGEPMPAPPPLATQGHARSGSSPSLSTAPGFCPQGASRLTSPTLRHPSPSKPRTRAVGQSGCGSGRRRLGREVGHASPESGAMRRHHRARRPAIASSTASSTSSRRPARVPDLPITASVGSGSVDLRPMDRPAAARVQVFPIPHNSRENRTTHATRSNTGPSAHIGDEDEADVGRDHPALAAPPATLGPG